MLLRFDELNVLPGLSVFPGDRGEKGFKSVCIDSRNLSPGALFIALTGTVQDGHSYIEAALKAGASGIMAAKSRLHSLNLVQLLQKWGKTLIIAEDCLRGLQNIAKYYLEKFPELLKIAITGSSGKTTTKEIAAAIIGQEKKTVMNTGNMNSETGLPLSVFNVRGDHEVGIFEAGMNRSGEIAELAEVLKPDIALITNIGSAHIGILGSKEKIAEEKKKIFSRFRGNEKALIPMEDGFRNFLADGVKGKIIFYGQGSFPELGKIRDLGLEGTELNWAGKDAGFPLPGAHNLENAIAALAIAREIPVSAESIRRGLESVKPLFGRSEIFRGEITLVRDCYNSNPESLEAVISCFAGIKWPGRKIYIIGSMFELGDLSAEAHRTMGNILASSGAEKIFLYGQETKTAADVLAAGSLPFFQTDKMDDLKQAVQSCIKPGDLVLLKGSRGCALEDLCPVFPGMDL